MTSLTLPGKGFYDNERARKVINEFPPIYKFQGLFGVKLCLLFSLKSVYKMPIHT